MPEQPTTVDVNFRIWWAGNKVRGQFEKNPPGDDQEVEFHNLNSSGLFVNFNLVDDGGTGLRFPDQAARALWVHTVTSKNGPCPPEGATWPGFRPHSVLNQGTTLRVRNPNERQQLFRFSLNFTASPSDPTSRLEPWDPIGSNRNGGGIELQRLSFSKTLLGVSAVVAAIAAVARLIKGKL